METPERVFSSTLFFKNFLELEYEGRSGFSALRLAAFSLLLAFSFSLLSLRLSSHLWIKRSHKSYFRISLKMNLLLSFFEFFQGPLGQLIWHRWILINLCFSYIINWRRSALITQIVQRIHFNREYYYFQCYTICLSKQNALNWEPG